MNSIDPLDSIDSKWLLRVIVQEVLSKNLSAAAERDSDFWPHTKGNDHNRKKFRKTAGLHDTAPAVFVFEEYI